MMVLPAIQVVMTVSFVMELVRDVMTVKVVIVVVTWSAILDAMTVRVVTEPVKDVTIVRVVIVDAIQFATQDVMTVRQVIRVVQDIHVRPAIHNVMITMLPHRK